MPELIERDKAIEKLREIQAKHRSRTCSRSALIQADALGYAIEILRQLPAVEINEKDGE